MYSFVYDVWPQIIRVRGHIQEKPSLRGYWLLRIEFSIRQHLIPRGLGATYRKISQNIKAAKNSLCNTISCPSTGVVNASARTARRLDEYHSSQSLRRPYFLQLSMGS